MTYNAYSMQFNIMQKVEVHNTYHFQFSFSPFIVPHNDDSVPGKPGQQYPLQP